ncbi:unnamed protein product [Auanema sp. JU1783]|nr:unnamed protein product [Auanema sp. JU1783]
MFARRNLVAEEDDNDTEATMLFNAKAKEDLRKMAPTAAERAERHFIPGVPAMASVKKKLTFDDTFTFDCPTLPASKSALADKENEISVLQRQLRDYKYKNEQLSDAQETLESQLEQLRAEKSDLKNQVLELEEDVKLLQTSEPSFLDVTQGDDWRQVANKYCVWFNTAREQLLQSQLILKNNKLWNAENVRKLTEAGQLQFQEFSNDDLGELISGSIQDYNIFIEMEEDEELQPQINMDAVPELEPPRQDPVYNQNFEEQPVHMSVQDPAPGQIYNDDMEQSYGHTMTHMYGEQSYQEAIPQEQSFAHSLPPQPYPQTMPQSSQSHTFPPQPQTTQQDVINDESIVFDATQETYPHSFMSRKSRIATPSPIKPESASNLNELDQSSMFNSTLHNTSIDYEKDKKIDWMESRISELEECLKLLRCRSQKYLQAEEEKRSLTNHVEHLNKVVKQTMSELAGLKLVIAEKLVDMDGTPRDTCLKDVDRIKALAIQLNEVIAARDKYYADLMEASEENALLKETVAQQKQRIEQNERTLKEQRDFCVDAEQNKEKLEKCNQELMEAKSMVSSHELTIMQLQQTRNETMTDAGDSTQIFHMARNPLQDAHDAFRTVEERKRKADETYQDESGKRFCNEEIESLKAKLSKAENEKVTVESTLSNFAMKYRAMITVLSGFQFKVKDIDEGICYVNSVYDDSDNEFVFKYDYESQQVDLLDSGPSNSTSVWGTPEQQFESEMRRYIGERQSVPAFLASVTLALESRRNFSDNSTMMPVLGLEGMM